MVIPATALSSPRAMWHAGAAKHAAEPVFSVSDPVLFQDFASVFRTDLDDPALRNAVMLTFAFAVTGGNMDQECVGYQNRALASIRERMSSPEIALTLPTLGAILLLAGIEVRTYAMNTFREIFPCLTRRRCLLLVGSIRHAVACTAPHGCHTATTRHESV